MNKLQFRKCLMMVPVVMLSGCLGFLAPITKDHKILGQQLTETVLIVDEDYSDESTFVPAGTYVPDSTFSNGLANYLGVKPISVKLMGFMSRQCYGGVSVDLDSPVKEYKLFLYFCGGERVITYSIPKKLKFRIVDRASLRSN